MSDNSSPRKIYFIYFHSVNVKRNWTHLAQKNSPPRAGPMQYLGCHENKDFKNIWFALSIKIM